MFNQNNQYKQYNNDDESCVMYNTILWIISSGDDFSITAKEMARKNNVRLINGKEFAKLLLENTQLLIEKTPKMLWGTNENRINYLNEAQLLYIYIFYIFTNCLNLGSIPILSGTCGGICKKSCPGC